MNTYFLSQCHIITSIHQEAGYVFIMSAGGKQWCRRDPVYWLVQALLYCKRSSLVLSPHIPSQFMLLPRFKINWHSKACDLIA